MEELADCPVCGREVLASAATCGHCGASLAEAVRPVSVRRPEKRQNVYLWIFDAPLSRDTAITVGFFFGVYSILQTLYMSAEGPTPSWPLIAFEFVGVVLLWSFAAAGVRRILRAIAVRRSWPKA